MPAVTTIEAYIAAASPAEQKRLQELCKVIRKAAPAATEGISYGMPAWKHQGMLVCIATHAAHTGFYPMPSGIAAFAKELKGYTGAKGSVQFPHNQPQPLDLVEKIVRFRVQENEAKAAAKKTSRKK